MSPQDRGWHSFSTGVPLPGLGSGQLSLQLPPPSGSAPPAWPAVDHSYLRLGHSLCFQNTQPEAVVLERSEKAGPEGTKRSRVLSRWQQGSSGLVSGCRTAGQEVPGRCCCCKDQMKEPRTEDWVATAKPANAREENKGPLGAGQAARAQGREPGGLQGGAG